MAAVRRKEALQFAGIYLAIAGVTALHYLTGAHAHQQHDIYRRLYYLPIILGAFLHGLPGGAAAAIVVCIVYLPHALGYISHDPASSTTKILEMVLYLAVGLITGWLVSHLKGTQRRLEGAARDLGASLAQLRAAEERLVQEARLAAVGRLSAGLAHEIRNPLASIKGSAEILSDDFPAEHPKRRMLQVLIDEAGRLNDVLTRFLAFARPSPPCMEPVSLTAELDAVVALLENRSASDRGRLRVEPHGCADVRLRADPRQMRQVLMNVLLNALQAGDGTGMVRIRCRRADGRLVIAVQDSGPGFTPEALENAFTPFFTTRSEGTGLGLALSHRIVELHGGTIRLSNSVEGGGLVEVALPIAQ